MGEELLLPIELLMYLQLIPILCMGRMGSTDPPAVNSGSMIVEFLSGDPAKNLFAFVSHFFLQ